jgi:hypothetical protein
MCHNLGVERYGLFCSFNIVCLLDKSPRLAGIQLWKHFHSGRSEYGLRPKDTVNDMISRAFPMMIGRKLSMNGKGYSGLMRRCAVPLCCSAHSEEHQEIRTHVCIECWGYLSRAKEWRSGHRW